MKLLVMAALLAALVPGAASGADTHAPSPRVAAIEAYRQAKLDGDWETVRSLLSSDARIWFEKKDGDGGPIKTGGGPWSDWDRYFQAKSTPVGDYAEGDTSVSVVVDEINDYYRLLDRPGARYRATYFFAGDGRIAGLLIEGIDRGDTRGKTDQFLAWAREHRPDEVKALMPDGEIVPSIENARRWRALLIAWRAAAGLPPIE